MQEQALPDFINKKFLSMKNEDKDILEKFFDGELKEEEKSQLKNKLREDRQLQQDAFSEYLVRKAVHERYIEELNEREIKDPGFDFKEIRREKRKTTVLRKKLVAAAIAFAITALLAAIWFLFS